MHEISPYLYLDSKLRNILCSGRGIYVSIIR